MLLVQRPSSNATEGGAGGGDRNRNGEKGRESLDIIEGDNLRRQMGRNGARGEQMDSRDDGRRETRTRTGRDGVRDLEVGGCEEKRPRALPMLRFSKSG